MAHLNFVENNLFVQLDHLTCLIAQIGFICTSLMVLLFNVLTLFFVRRDFGTYRNLLISFSLLGFLFSSSEYIVQPMIHSYNAGFVFFTNRRTPEIANEVMKIGLVSFCGLYGSTVCFIAVQFLYRYWALFDVVKLRFFEGWKLSIWFFYSFVLGIIWAIGIYFFLETDTYSRIYFKYELLKQYGVDINQIPVFTSVIYMKDGELRYRNLMCTLEMTLIIGSQYLIICFCGTQMSVGMKEKISMLSQTRKRLHTQFFKSLVLQIVVPTVVLFIPVITIIYLPIFDIKFSFPTGIVFSAFALYPAIDIIIIIYIVSDYQKAIVNVWMAMKLALGSNYFHTETSTIISGHPLNTMFHVT